MSQNADMSTIPASPLSVDAELSPHAAWLERFRGRNHIGLPQITLPLLDAYTSGLRGLMLLAAPPNVGKTALTVQLGVDVVRANPDACFLFVSLEMPRMEILTRIICRLGGLEWSTLVKGSFERRNLGNGTPGAEGESWFNAVDQAKLDKARAELASIGGRVRILDDDNCGDFRVERIVAEVERLKSESGADKCFILVDYLQVWPVPPGTPGIITESDEDKWRVGQMKALRDAIRARSPRDGVLVISEARAPSQAEKDWAGPLADVMRSARTGYTPDMVFILEPVTYKMQGISEEMMRSRGVSHLKLKVAKGRDGVTRGAVNLTFHYFESRFEEGHV